MFSRHITVPQVGSPVGPDPDMVPVASVIPPKVDNTNVTAKNRLGLVLGGGLPAIPADIMKRVEDNSYVELSELLPEKIQEAFLYPDSKGKKKAQPLDKFVDWVLAFTVYSQALLAKDPTIAGDLIIFIGTVARLARDHPGAAWAIYERNFRANAVADPSTKWSTLNQEVWALSTVSKASMSASSGPGLPQPPSKRRAQNTCDKWNEGSFCPFKTCRFYHACSTCLSPQHRASSCPGALKSSSTPPSKKHA